MGIYHWDYIGRFVLENPGKYSCCSIERLGLERIGHNWCSNELQRVQSAQSYIDNSLVELIVLNVGLQAGILSQRVFTIFVVMALVTTFLTTPIVSYLYVAQNDVKYLHRYPPSYQRKLDLWRQGEIDWNGNPISRTDESASDEKASLARPLIQKCLIVLNRMEDIPSMMTITKLLASALRDHTSSSPPEDTQNVLKIHCLRLVELTQRASAVMRVSERHFDKLDPVINIFRTFGKLNEVLVTAKMAIVPDDSFSDSVYYQGLNSKAEMVIIPWSTHAPSVGPSSAVPQDQFVKVVLDKVESHVSVMIDTQLHLDDDSPLEPSLSRSISMSSLRTRPRTATSPSEGDISPVPQLQEGYYIFLPYFGGRDDRIALSMVIQLLRCPDVKATVVRIGFAEGSGKDSVAVPPPTHVSPSKDILSITEAPNTANHSSPIASAVYGKLFKNIRFPGRQVPPNTPQTSEHDTEDDENDFKLLLDSVPAELKSRLNIENVTTNTPLQYVVERAKLEIDSKAASYHLVIVGRATKHPRASNIAAVLRKDLKDIVQDPVGETVGKSSLGDAGEAMLLGRVTGGILVVQSSQDIDEL